MYAFVITIHVIACFLLVAIVLIQSGRGGGLTETFSSAESIFGTKTNAFLTRATSVLATIFIITCLSLTFISTRRSKSLMDQVPVKQEQVLPAKTEEKKEPVQDAAKSDEAKQQAPGENTQKAPEADAPAVSK